MFKEVYFCEAEIQVITHLFTKLSWPGNSEWTFRFSSQGVTCPSVCYTRLHTYVFIAERQARRLNREAVNTNYYSLRDLTQLETKSSVSVAETLSTRSLIGKQSI